MNLGALTEDGGLGSGVPNGDAIVRLVDAVVASARLGDGPAGGSTGLPGDALPGDGPALLRAREEVRAVLGWDGLVDIGGVIGAFTMQNRVADGVGLPLDTPIELASRSVQQQLGAERFQSASNTERGGAAKALAARLVGAVVPSLLRLSGRRAKTAPP